METQNSSDRVSDATKFKFYDYLEVDGEEAITEKFIKSLSPMQSHILHNMRTSAVSQKLMLQPKHSDFATHWDQLTGQILTLTTLIGDGNYV